ncbi:MAG TPA: biotin/lipoyl-binding protein [Myxococcota bacterium]|nr:biotin/lipoyl-binding protein [Myxococcota bacterium]
MEALLLGIYAFFVWLIFIKLKWLPWNIVSQVTVAIIPIVGLTAMILLLNIVAPSSHDVRVYRYVVPIVSQVRGRVIEVPIEEGNVPVKKGDVLFRVDPKPFQLDVNTLQARLATSVAQERELEESLKGARGAVDAAAARVRETAARLELAKTRVIQNRELAQTGAGNRFDLEQAETSLLEAQSQAQAARASQVQAVAAEQQVKQKLGAKAGGEYAQVAQLRAELERAQWELDQTTTYSPCDCYVINLQLRPGGFMSALALNPVMSLVETTGTVVAFYNQNELHKVAPGDEAEFTLETYPGKVIKGKVNSIVWASGAGQLQASGTLPMTGVLAQPPNRFAVKFDVAEKDQALFLAPGASGQAAIYTEHLEMIQILRKVIVRVGSYLNYLILKLH